MLLGSVQTSLGLRQRMGDPGQGGVVPASSAELGDQPVPLGACLDHHPLGLNQESAQGAG